MTYTLQPAQGIAENHRIYVDAKIADELAR